MEWFTRDWILVAVLLATCIVYLLDRVKRLEKAVQRTSIDLVNVVNHLYMAIARPPVEAEGLKARDMSGALKLIDHYIGYRIASHSPALRRVLSLTIGISLEFLVEKTGITSNDLKGLEEQRSGDGSLFPACSMVIEEWATHRVVRDFSGQTNVHYDAWSDGDFRPIVLWRHALPRKREGEREACLEVVLVEGSVKFWAREGRFGSMHSETAARDEFIFVAIPLKEENLTEYRGAFDMPSDDPQIAQVPWIRHYGSCGGKTWWNLTVNDVVSSY